MKVLLTGAAGTIGSCLRRDLGSAFDIRCFDLIPIVDAADMVVADVVDEARVLEAMQGVDAVVHLAANPEIEQSWQDVVWSGIKGTRCVFEAARREGIERIVYASSAHVTGWREIESETKISVDTPALPKTDYGLGKLFCEQMARLYAERHGLTIVCLRIGAFHDSWEQLIAKDDPLLRTYCSARDLAQLVRRSLESPPMGFVVFYGVSGNRRRLWDISNARQLVGYEPQDDAERFLQTETLRDRFRRLVGGSKGY